MISLYFFSKDQRKDRDDDRRRYDRRRDHHRRHRDHDDRHRNSERNRSDRRKNWEIETPRSRRKENADDDGDFETPYLKPKDTPSRASWEDEDYRTPGKLSSWDLPTPGSSRREDDDDWSSRKSSSSYRKSSSRPHYDKETPLPTPTYKKNSWHNKKDGKDHSKSSRRSNNDKVDNEEYEEEQKRLDREWYGLDEGYDESHNPFAGISAEYTKKKEEQMEQKKHRRLTAKQAQRHKDNELWEKNRMFRSGAVTRTDYDEDFEEISEAKVHLIVNNIIPPFLDGRIVFTKQQEPVVPIRDPTSDMAMVSKKGSKLVKVHREQAERRKAQKKEWELAGTKLGNILGVQKTDDSESKDTEDTMDHREGQKFAEHMKVEQEKSSTFSKTKSLKEQRQFLPVFACRHELLKIIRDNK